VLDHIVKLSGCKLCSVGRRVSYKAIAENGNRTGQILIKVCKRRCSSVLCTALQGVTFNFLRNVLQKSMKSGTSEHGAITAEASQDAYCSGFRVQRKRMRNA
jgi:hypothetical protein